MEPRVWCLRGLKFAPELQMRIWLLAWDTPLARIFRRYKWQFRVHDVLGGDWDGYWRIRPIHSGDYLTVHIPDTDMQLRWHELRPPAPTDDYEDFDHFSYGALTDSDASDASDGCVSDASDGDV